MAFNISRMKNLFGPKKLSATVTVPAGERIYVIGDIHGRADLLQNLHEMIIDDAAARGWARNQVIYLGDYIDRGPDSRGVMALAMGDNLPGMRKTHLRGNHEVMALQFMESPEQGAEWLHWGGDVVLREYGITAPSEFSQSGQLAHASKLLAEAMLPGELAFLQNLKPCHRAGGYFFTHAGVRPGTPLDAQKDQDLIWIREPFLRYNNDFGAIVVHGHTVCNAVEIKANRIGIDTGAYTTGILTCLVLETNKRWLLQTGHQQFKAILV
jgi:serine/threonine protein phosphatase 1